MEHPRQVPRFRSDLLRDAALTCAAVVVSLLALDDIGTDTAATFAVERITLACCGVSLLSVAWRLIRDGHRILGAVSLVAVVAGAVAQPAVGAGILPSLRFEYVATGASLMWFMGLAGILATLALGQATRSLTSCRGQAVVF